MLKKIVFFYTLLLVFAGCTRDDICPEETATTPLLQIQFKDITDRTQSKTVSALRVLINDADTLEVYLGESDTLVGIPLNTLATVSSFQFIANSNDDTTVNNDIITFRYSTEDIYVNRACAFKTIYNDLEVDLEPETGSNNWIQDLTLLKTTVEDETEAHLTIFH
ncbi:MAG: DUF6452 family protein [Bacteroidota bacterium]